MELQRWWKLATVSLLESVEFSNKIAEWMLFCNGLRVVSWFDSHLTCVETFSEWRSFYAVLVLLLLRQCKCNQPKHYFYLRATYDDDYLFVCPCKTVIWHATR